MRWCAIVFSLVLASALQASHEEAARKILTARCWACHTQAAMGGLRLDSREAILQGGRSGSALVPGDAARSRLIQAVLRTAPGVKPMPPDSALKPEEIEILKAWIDGGAPWSQAKGQHWAFLPLRAPAPGATIDALIAAGFASKGLTPNARADKRTLIRRAYFDLVGLPPTPDEFDAAFQDDSSDWFARLVDRLLASPHFGEKWGRHWLDVARYGEDDFTGTEVKPYANAWRYREWVVNAFNEDLPYDRFLIAQLAGDLLGDPSLLPATGLMGGGPWYYGIAQPAQSRADERHDRVDMVSRGMLGVTLACARCHDHKYDPFTAHDYYAMAGVFASSAYKEYPLVPAEESAAWDARKKEVDEAEKALKRYLDEQAGVLAEHFARRIAAYMLAANGVDATGLHPKVLQRWKDYLAKPEEFHPYLDRWFAGQRSPAEAEAFQNLILEIAVEKKSIDEENRALIEEAKKQEEKPRRTIILPGGYRSDEDFNPGAYIPSKSLARDRYVAWNRVFGESSAPLKFNGELTAELLDENERPRYEHLKSRAEELKKALPPQYPYLHGMGEFEPWDLNLNIRGNPEQLGEVVPRRFPLALSGGKPIYFNEGSGRLELARTVAAHPLAARVAVNRIWLALFGQGLVRTPSNFGLVGDRPALPEVLEFLAHRFVESGYSMKGVIREVVLSEAYQRSSSNSPENLRIDAENRYHWRQSRRRLEAELLRDSLLAVSGELDRSVGGESQPLEPEFRRRTIYARLGRFQQDETLSLFDLPSASVTCEQRAVTNVPLQKLFFLNSEIVVRQANALAAKLAVEGNPEPGVRAAYRQLFQRAPDEREIELGREFLASSEAEPDRWTQYMQVLLSSNEFSYVD
ncbi:MAG: PSD1 and planctomycete cytochrome C domain-containing protein [Bryobacteraceae bacterium]